jgi:hypothetical protein
MSSFTKIYDLRDDSGLRGVTGSPAWWDAVTSGRLAQHLMEGRIVSIFGSGLPGSDWPEFEIESAGNRTRWSRYASAGEADSRERRDAIELYQVGRRVRLRYVLQPIEPPLPGKAFVKTVLELWIGDDRG